MTISGAGPSLFVAVKEGTQEEIAKKLEMEFPYYRAIAITPSPTGTTIKKTPTSQYWLVGIFFSYMNRDTSPKISVIPMNVYIRTRGDPITPNAISF